MDSKWQPIATAPKNGTKILICFGRMIYAAWWDDQFESSCSARGKVAYHGAWTDNAVASFGYEETHSYEPTHWMPLPALPVKTEPTPTAPA